MTTEETLTQREVAGHRQDRTELSGGHPEGAEPQAGPTGGDAGNTSQEHHPPYPERSAPKASQAGTRAQARTGCAQDALRVMMNTYDHVCAARITPYLAWMAEHLGPPPPSTDSLPPLTRRGTTTSR